MDYTDLDKATKLFDLAVSRRYTDNNVVRFFDEDSETVASFFIVYEKRKLLDLYTNDNDVIAILNKYEIPDYAIKKCLRRYTNIYPSNCLCNVLNKDDIKLLECTSDDIDSYVSRIDAALSIKDEDHAISEIAYCVRKYLMCMNDCDVHGIGFDPADLMSVFEKHATNVKNVMKMIRCCCRDCSSVSQLTSEYTEDFTCHKTIIQCYYCAECEDTFEIHIES